MNIKYYIKNPLEAVVQLLCRYGKKMSDEKYLKIMYFLRMHHRLDLVNPKSFSEKLQWLKLYDRRPEYTQMVDKYAVKEYVAKVLGPECIIPTIGVWDKPEEIEWDKLPNKFVLKTTHGGGGTGVFVCKDKSTIDKEKIIKNLTQSLDIDIYTMLKEWPYKDVPRRIIAEEFIDPIPGKKDLPDYKVFCFNGEPKFCQVITGRDGEMCTDFFDKDWKHQPFHEPKEYPFAKIEPQKPKYFDLMWKAANKLAAEKSFTRIDFYETKDKILFGEITFFPTSGFGRFNPNEYDRILGQMIALPGENEGG